MPTLAIKLIVLLASKSRFNVTRYLMYGDKYHRRRQQSQHNTKSSKQTNKQKQSTNLLTLFNI